MNAIQAPLKPCRTVEEWLTHHAATRLPTGYALGLSALERDTGMIANTQTWTQKVQNQTANEVRAAKQKHLRSGKKSRK